MADHKHSANQNSGHAFVRAEDTPLLPPPATGAGITGWLWQNIFANWLTSVQRGRAYAQHV